MGFSIQRIRGSLICQQNPMNPTDNLEQQAETRHLADSIMLFLFAWSIRTLHTWCIQMAPFFTYKIGDADRYDLWARDIAGGNWLGTEVFYQAPLYPYFLATIYTFLGDSISSVRTVQIILGAASCVFLMNATKNLFDRRAGIVAGVVMALFAPSIFLESLVQKSILDLFLISALIWLCTKTLTSQSKRWWVWMGLSLGLLCLSRENALILIPVVGLWALLRKPIEGSTLGTSRQKLGACLAIGLGLAITLFPVALRNYYVGGELHLTTSQLGPNFYIGNNPEADGTYKPMKVGRGDARYEQTDAVDIAEEAMGRELTPKEVSDYFMSESLAYIKGDPVGWMKLLGTKTLLMINATETIDTEDQYTHASWSILLRTTGMIFHFGTLFPLAIIGIWLTRRDWRKLLWAHMMLIAFAASVIGFFVFGRYRFPLVPLLIVFTGPAITMLYDQWRDQGAKMVVRYAPVVLGLVVLCNLPIVDTTEARSVTYSNFGGAALVHGDLEMSETYFKKALAIKPDNVWAHNNLGVLYWKRKDNYKLAEMHFKKAIEINPDFDSARSRLERLKSETQSQ